MSLCQDAWPPLPALPNAVDERLARGLVRPAEDPPLLCRRLVAPHLQVGLHHDLHSRGVGALDELLEVRDGERAPRLGPFRREGVALQGVPGVDGHPVDTQRGELPEGGGPRVVARLFVPPVHPAAEGGVESGRGPGHSIAARSDAAQGPSRQSSLGRRPPGDELPKRGCGLRAAQGPQRAGRLEADARVLVAESLDQGEGGVLPSRRGSGAEQPRSEKGLVHRLAMKQLAGRRHEARLLAVRGFAGHAHAVLELDLGGSAPPSFPGLAGGGVEAAQLPGEGHGLRGRTRRGAGGQQAEAGEGNREQQRRGQTHADDGSLVPVDLELTWEGDQRFRGRSGSVELTLDGNAQAGASPVQALAFALASCMAIDVVHILTKGRHEPGTVRARLEADRASHRPAAHHRGAPPLLPHGRRARGEGRARDRPVAGEILLGLALAAPGHRVRDVLRGGLVRARPARLTGAEGRLIWRHFRA